MSIINQPYDGNLEDELISFLDAQSSLEYIFISVAYAKMSGVNRLYNRFNDLLATGCTIIVAAGIDQKNTSYEALNQLLNVTTQLFIYHDTNPGVTYHPKIYYIQSPDHTAVFTGSNNLTAGGLYLNDEIFTYHYDDYSLAPTLGNIINRYTDINSDFCYLADSSFIEELYIQNLILSESQINASLGSNQNFNRNNYVNIFGRSNPPRRVNILTNNTINETLEIEDSRSFNTNNEHLEIPISPISLNLDELPSCFWKVLSNNDVSTTSSPGQMIIPISFESFFTFRNPIETQSGGQQSEFIFDAEVCIVNESNAYDNINFVFGARAVLYTPAPNHPRQNTEIRFTFRNRQIFNQLEASDILLFVPRTLTEDNSASFVIYVIKPTAPIYQTIRQPNNSRYAFLN